MGCFSSLFIEVRCLEHFTIVFICISQPSLAYFPRTTELSNHGVSLPDPSSLITSDPRGEINQAWHSGRGLSVSEAQRQTRGSVAALTPLPPHGPCQETGLAKRPKVCKSIRHTFAGK